MIALILTLILIAQASSDAFYFLNKKKISKAIECAYIVLFLVLPVFVCCKDFKTISALMLLYLFIRLAIYDIAFNLTAGLSIKYIGTTSYIYDDFMGKLKSWQFWVFRLFFAFLAIIIYLKIFS